MQQVRLLLLQMLLMGALLLPLLVLLLLQLLLLLHCFTQLLGAAKLLFEHRPSINWQWLARYFPQTQPAGCNATIIQQEACSWRA